MWDDARADFGDRERSSDDRGLFTLTDGKRLHSLDAARGIAALAVVVWHWQHMYEIGGGKLVDRTAQPFYAVLFPFYEAGWLAVEFFFTLSGFVFFWLYGEAIAQKTLGLGKFWVARFSRLYPLHLLTLLLIAALQGLLMLNGHETYVYGGTTLWNFLLNLLFLQYFVRAWTFNGPEWSVGVEVLLYAGFFLYCRLLKPRWLLPLLALVLFGMWVMYKDWGLGRGIVGFFAGGVTYEVWRRLKDRPLAKRIALPLIAGVAMLWVVGIVELRTHWIAAALNGIGLEGWRWLENFFRLGLVPLSVLALALHEQTGARFWQRISPLGDLTYALYLWHFPLQLIAAVVVTLLALPVAPLQTPAAFVTYMVVLIGVSILSYRYIERPAQSWLRHKLSPRKDEHAAKSPA